MEACRYVLRNKEGEENDTATSDVSDANNNATNTILPEIELKVCDTKVLLNVYCEKRKGTLGTIFKELDKYDLGLVNCSITPFNNTAFDITIVAQMEEGFSKNISTFIKTLRSALVLVSPDN